MWLYACRHFLLTGSTAAGQTSENSAAVAAGSRRYGGGTIDEAPHMLYCGAVGVGAPPVIVVVGEKRQPVEPRLAPSSSQGNLNRGDRDSDVRSTVTDAKLVNRHRYYHNYRKRKK
jgi:hypothetical protein